MDATTQNGTSNGQATRPDLSAFDGIDFSDA
jgi:hypothetical protein